MSNALEGMGFEPEIGDTVSRERYYEDSGSAIAVPPFESQTMDPKAVHKFYARVKVDAPTDAWRQNSACRGPQGVYFFPPSHFERKAAKESREKVAKDICRTCIVQTQCLEFALTNKEKDGIWGGMNESELRLLRQRRA